VSVPEASPLVLFLFFCGLLFWFFFFFFV